MQVFFKKLHQLAVTPEYKTDGAACADLHAVFDSPFDYTYIHPNATEIIQTGLAVEVPRGYELQVRSRSGMASKGVILANGVGTIDSDYRGGIGVILTNCGPDVVKITTGDRIAQCCLNKLPKMEFIEVDDLEETERGGGGFGSTGS